MVIGILFIILFSLFFLMSKKQTGNDYFSIIMGALAGLVVSFALYSVISLPVCHNYVETDKQFNEIINVKESVDYSKGPSIPIYSFYYREEGNEYNKRTLPIADVLIREDSSVTSRLEWTILENKYKKFWFPFSYYPAIKIVDYTFVVPKWSIERNLKIENKI